MSSFQLSKSILFFSYLRSCSGSGAASEEIEASPHVPQGGTSKDGGPRFHRRAKSKCKCEKPWRARWPGGWWPTGAVGASAEVTVCSGSTGAVGVSSLPVVLFPTLISTAKALKPSLLMPGFKIPKSKIHVQSVIRADF